MTNGFLNDLPELDLPGRKRKKKSPVPGAPGQDDQVVRYIKIRCPKCDSDRVPVYSSRDLPVRYHKCSACGHTFKSIEENYPGENKHLNSGEEKGKVE